jgi:hypothetical protein
MGLINRYVKYNVCGTTWNLILYEIVHRTNFKFIHECTWAKALYFFVLLHHQYDAMTVYFLLIVHCYILLILGIQHTIQLQEKSHIILRNKMVYDGINGKSILHCYESCYASWVSPVVHYLIENKISWHPTHTLSSVNTLMTLTVLPTKQE